MTRSEKKQKKQKFLEAYAELGVIGPAAREAGVLSRQTVYSWRSQDEEFERQFQEIKEDLIEQVELTLFQKAKAGEYVPMIVFLKANRPGMYIERHQIQAIGGGMDLGLVDEAVSYLNGKAEARPELPAPEVPRESQSLHTEPDSVVSPLETEEE